jgi:hypothetical protein
MYMLVTNMQIVQCSGLQQLNLLGNYEQFDGGDDSDGGSGAMWLSAPSAKLLPVSRSIGSGLKVAIFSSLPRPGVTNVQSELKKLSESCF